MASISHDKLQKKMYLINRPINYLHLIINEPKMCQKKHKRLQDLLCFDIDALQTLLRCILSQWNFCPDVFFILQLGYLHKTEWLKVKLKR